MSGFRMTVFGMAMTVGVLAAAGLTHGAIDPVAGGEFVVSGQPGTADAEIASLVVGPNHAASTNGAVAFSSSNIGGFPADNINDGVHRLTGGDQPWIGLDDTAPDTIGVNFSGPITLGGWTIEGWYPDRSTGTWQFEYTTNGSDWNTIDTFDTGQPQGVDTPVLEKTLFAITPINNVSGFRIITGNAWTGGDIGMNLGELEVYSLVIPEPASMALIGLAGLMMIRRTRQ